MRPILSFLLSLIGIKYSRTAGTPKSDTSSPIPSEAFDIFPHIDFALEKGF